MKVSSFGAIVGATGFIGSKIASYFASKGFKLLLIGRNSSELDLLANNLIMQYGSQVDTLEIDFENLGKVDWGITLSECSFLINTVGLQPPIGAFIDVNLEEWEYNFKINLFSTSRITQIFAKHFSINGGGSIILFSGGGGSTPRPFFSSYSTSKAALVRFVETVSIELIQHNIKINAIAPGVMPSRMMREVLEYEQILGQSEIISAKSSLGDYESDFTHIFELCNFLISPQSDGITGKLISAKWDNWSNWSNFIDELSNTELYTLRRITARDKNLNWGDL
jgi:3-oxoacyl-[acyl-carrier protein] reductase